MSNRYAHILAAGGAAALVAALGVTAALAATAKTWTVSPGGTITAAAGRGTLTDIAPKHAMRCFSLTARGTLRSGSGLPGADVGSLSADSFATCAYPLTSTLLIDFFLHAGGPPWQVNLFSYNAATGVVRGTISHIAITVSPSPSGAKPCTVIDGTSATADDGQVAFRYTDSTSQLTVLTTGGNLHYYDARKGSVCDGLFHDRGPATLSATFTVSPKQAIASP